MIRDRKLIALIPARGGSKGIPRKNLALLAGQPLLAWTATAAKWSMPPIDKIHVSTDDEEISKVALDRGCSVIHRPAHLSTDTAKGHEVVLHAIETLELHPRDYLIYLQPTSPLRLPIDIGRAAQLLEEHPEAESVVSVTECEHHPLWSGILRGSGDSMANFVPRLLMYANRQDLPTYYRLNGAVYISQVQYTMDVGGFVGPKTISYVMPRERSIDIDSPIDITIAETVMQQAKKNIRSKGEG